MLLILHFQPSPNGPNSAKMAEDEEDYIFYGTPIEREEDTSARKRKAIADAGQLRSLPAWKQEVSPHQPIPYFSF